MLYGEETMIDSNTLDHLAQYESDKLPLAIIRKQNDIVPTNAQDRLLANLLIVPDTQTGSPAIYFILNDSSGGVDNPGRASIAEQLQEIKERFGLNLSQLSKILNVSRPQLYKWLDGEGVPQRDEFNQKITEAYLLTRQIPLGHSKYFGKLAKRYTADGVTVLDALADSDLDNDRLLAIYESIKSDIESIERRKVEEIDKHHKYGATEVILPPNDTST